MLINQARFEVDDDGRDSNRCLASYSLDEKSGGYLDSFKPYMFQELGRDLASNPHTTFGFAKTIYEQMEKYVK